MKYLNLALFLTLVLGVGIRFYGLDHRKVFGDEEFYRGGKNTAFAELGTPAFRNHSVKHFGGAPHGLLSMAVDLAIGKTVLELFGPWLPEDPYRLDNVLCRLGNVISNVIAMFLLAVFSIELFGKPAALVSTLMFALSGNQINWSRVEYLDPPVAMTVFAAHFFLWRSIVAIRQDQIFRNGGFAFLAGIFAAAAVGVKWPALFLVISMPLSYLVIRAVDLRSLRFLKNDFIFLALFLLGWFGMAFLCHSQADFRTIWIADVNDLSGDIAYKRGAFTLIWESILALKPVYPFTNWLAIGVLYGGLPCLFLFFGAIGLFFKDGWRRQTAPRDVFLGAYFASALVYTLISRSWYNHRAMTLAIAVILVGGIVLERLSKRTIIVTVLLVFFTAGPIGIWHGLRLGDPVFSYSYFQSYYNDELPSIPPFPVFYKKPRHYHFGGIFRQKLLKALHVAEDR